MSKVVEFLQANPVQYLATVGRDGKAKCRPFMFSGEMDGKLWFCTNNTKDVYKDMQSKPGDRNLGFQPGVRMDSPARQGCFREQHGCQGDVHRRTRSSRASTARRPTRSLRCSISRMHTAVSLISPEIRRISFKLSQSACKEPAG